jgi:PAS domain S-box-containing protein
METAHKIKILLVEDDSGDYILFKESLNEIKNSSYSLTWASTYEKGLEIIQKKEHDIYFFDYLLGAKTGLDLISDSFKAGISSPIIILTGLRNQQTDYKAMELGASDYLVKDEMDGEKLERSIRYCIEHSRLIKKVKASETKFRSIFENSQDVMFVTDYSGNIVDVNKSCERLFGYTHAEMLKINAGDLYENKNDRERLKKEIKEAGNYGNYEVVMVDKFGNKKYCLLTVNVQPTEENPASVKNTFYQGIIHDMTERKKAEHNVMIAEKLAIAGKIARTLAHEVRNPLTNINLSVEQLEECITDKEHEPYFGIIKRNSKRINDLVTELIENSEVHELNEAAIPIHTVLQNTIDLASDRAKLKNIKIISDFKFQNEKVLADEPKLTIAFLNILINAIEAVKANTGVIKIDSTCNNNKCYVSIEDNGGGIKEEHLAKIFEPYFTSKSTGMGLGLATSQNIINTHNGVIGLQTELHKGTKFNIELNLA